MSGKKRSLCPECGKHASGNFCHHCGSSLGGKFCNHCGGDIAAGGKFCNQCGAGVAGGARVGKKSAPKAAATDDILARNDMPWWIAGGAVFILIVVVGWTMVRSTRPQLTGQGAAGVPPIATPTDLSQLSPRQTADDLFNRVMIAAENGDTAQVQQFMPMALQAYEVARPLDLDGLLHLAMLERTAGQFEEALATTEEMFAVEANHILALEVAARAAEALGREDEAAGYYRRILENYDVESVRPLMEYQGHAVLLTRALEGARTFLAAR